MLMFLHVCDTLFHMSEALNTDRSPHEIQALSETQKG